MDWEEAGDQPRRRRQRCYRCTIAGGNNGRYQSRGEIARLRGHGGLRGSCCWLPLNPIESKLERIRNVDESREDVKLAKAMLVGEDEFCVNFIQAFRDGKFRNY